MAAKVYTVAQVKGGSGKTTMAVGLACLLREVHGDVMVADLDVANTDIAHLLRRRQEFAKTRPDLGLLPLSFSVFHSYQKMGEAIVKAVKSGVNVVIDCPPTSEMSTVAAMTLSDVILAPARVGHLDPRSYLRFHPYLDVAYASRIKSGGSKQKVFTILTDWRPTKTARDFDEMLQGMTEKDGIPYTYLGTVPHSELLAKSLVEGVAFWELHPERAQAELFKSKLRKMIGR